MFFLIEKIAGSNSFVGILKKTIISQQQTIFTLKKINSLRNLRYADLLQSSFRIYNRAYLKKN